MKEHPLPSSYKFHFALSFVVVVMKSAIPIFMLLHKCDQNLQSEWPWWCTPVNSNTQKAEEEGLWVQGQLQLHSKTLSKEKQTNKTFLLQFHQLIYRTNYAQGRKFKDIR
jgi:hypothetical protein